MITLILGENSFENTRIIERIVAAFDGETQKVDGETLELRQLPDLLMGMSLFASKRLMIIKNLSANKTLWNEFEQWIDRVSDDVHLVLVEEKVDKRTKTYKLLQKKAAVHESKLWTERDTAQGEAWTVGEAKALGLVLDKKSVQALVRRAGLDQWRLYRALEKLAVLGRAEISDIEALVEANPTENVFYLFESALRGDAKKVRSMLNTLAATEDPYRLFGLLSTQVFQLALLATTDRSSAEVAKAVGAHPFALSKLVPFAQKRGHAGARRVVEVFAMADAEMKSSSVGPWLLVEQALMKTALLEKRSV